MAVCEECGKEMLEALTCAEDVVVLIAGVAFEPVLYGLEDVFLEPTESGEWWEPGRCHDCGIGPYGVHHFGCCVETCPSCRGQLLMCGCSAEPEGAQ